MALALQEIPFFKNLPESDLREIRNCLREKSFKKGETLFLESALCDRIFFVRTGRIKLYRMSSTGREQTLQTLEPGDTCACNPGAANWVCPSTAEAVVASTVWYISKEEYLQLLKSHPSLAYNLNHLLAQRLQGFSSLIEEVSLEHSRHRLIKFLLEMLAHHQDSHNNQLTVSFTREELAQRLGIARETVSRQLNELKRKKLIDIELHRIIIRNSAALQKLLEAS